MFVQLLVASQSLVTLSMSVLYYYYYHLLVEIIFINYYNNTTIKNLVSHQEDYYYNQLKRQNDDVYEEAIQKNINNNNKDNNCNLISAELEKQLLLHLSGNKKFNLVQCNLREKWPIVHTLVAYRNVDL